MSKHQVNICSENGNNSSNLSDKLPETTNNGELLNDDATLDHSSAVIVNNSREVDSSEVNQHNNVKIKMMEYRTLPLIHTRCYVVFVKNCLNLDIDFQLTDEQRKVYAGCIQNRYTYSVMDKNTFELQPPVEGVAYRSRLRGISSGGRKGKKGSQMHDNAMLKATIDMTNAVMLTSGFFYCELGDIDVFNRILVTLYDPITGNCINNSILKEYAAVFSQYGDERGEVGDAVPLTRGCGMVQQRGGSRSGCGGSYGGRNWKLNARCSSS